MIKLMIIDDEPRTLNGIVSLISNSNLSVEIVATASNGVTGLSLAKELLPDIVVTDVRMPKMDGIAFAFELKKIHPDCQIIFISSYAEKEYLKSAIALGAVSYVEKPIDMGEILNSISSAMQVHLKNASKREIINQNQLLYEKQREAICEKLALELITPNIGNDALEMLSSLCPDFINSPYYCSIICQINYATELDEASLDARVQIRNAINSITVPALFARKEKNIFLIHICCSDSQDTAAFHRTIEQFYSEVQKELSYSASPFLAVGYPVSNVKQIYSSYIEACISLKKLFFMGYNNICYFDNLDNNTENVYFIDNAVLARFAQALEKEERLEINHIIANILFDMRNEQHKYSVNSIKNVYYQLLEILNASCKKKGFTSVFSSNADYIWEKVVQKNTILELHYYIQKN